MPFGVCPSPLKASWNLLSACIKVIIIWGLCRELESFIIPVQLPRKSQISEIFLDILTFCPGDLWTTSGHTISRIYSILIKQLRASLLGNWKDGSICFPLSSKNQRTLHILQAPVRSINNCWFSKGSSLSTEFEGYIHDMFTVHKSF